MKQKLPDFHTTDEIRKEFLGIEPYHAGYKQQIDGNSRHSNPWALGSLGYYLYKQGVRDAEEVKRLSKPQRKNA